MQLREANEGDDSWKDTLAVQKKNEEEDAYFVGKVRCYLSSLFPFLRAPLIWPLFFFCGNRARAPPSLVLRRRRRSSSRSTPASSVPAVAAVDAEATGAGEGAERGALVAVVVLAVVDVVRARTVPRLRLPSTSTTRRRSRPCRRRLRGHANIRITHRRICK